MLYALGKSIGMAAIGWTMGLLTIHLVESSRGNRGPIHTALTQRIPGLIFLASFSLSLTGVYALLVDIFTAIGR